MHIAFAFLGQVSLLLASISAAVPTSNKALGQLSEEEKATRKADKQALVDRLEAIEDKGWTAKLHEHFALLDTVLTKKLSGTRVKPQSKKHMSGGTKAHELHQKPLRTDEPELQPVGEVQHFDVTRRKRSVTCTDYVFDVRNKWPQCAAIIGNIRDQSTCGSCWAVSASSTLTDRACIVSAKRGQTMSNTDSNYNSAADVMGCSGGAADGTDACNGGYLSTAWQWFTTNGVVSGNNYTQGGCKPYPFSPTNLASESYPANACQQSCSNTNYLYTYSQDLLMASDYHSLVSSGWEQTMKDELFANGSISAVLNVYDDFMHYGSGIYTVQSSNLQGGHAIRLIGYGNVTCSDGTSTKYWLGANSWNYDWGLNGLFKIKRGVNMAGIESLNVVFGTPIV